MKSIPVRTLASALIFLLPALSRAQDAGLADGFFSGGRADEPKIEVPAVPEPAASSKGPFVFDPAVNKQLDEKLRIPVFYAFPESAYARTSETTAPMEGLWDFRHPGAANAAAPVGLRVYLTPRKDVATRLAAGGFAQTGDIVMTFRPEWGFQGPYPNVQMGISHAGILYVENGVVSNIDNPLSQEFLGNLDSPYYRKAPALHIIRPRNLGAEQKANLLGWMKRLRKLAPQIFPSQLSFNQDYFSPKYTADLKFVKTVAQIALQQDSSAKIDIYCSELVWALLSLRDCDPGQPEQFAREGVPACVKPIFDPLQMVGDHFLAPKSPSSRIGLSDGPLAVIMSMGLPEPETKALLHEVFVKKPGATHMSAGHVAVAESLAPLFMPLENYYTAIHTGSPQAAAVRNAFNSKVTPNYPPAAYLVNTLLPTGSEDRKMDLVGTVVFSD